MNLTKKLSFVATMAAATLLAACQSQPSNTLYFTPAPTTGKFNTANQNIVLNVSTRDNRAQPEISSYVYHEQLLKLNSAPQVTQLFDQIVKQDLNAKGFRVGTPSSSNTNVIVNVNDFYAKVESGNLRHKINAAIQLDIQVQGAKGQYTKKIAATRMQEGAFSANNGDIHKVLNQTLAEVTQAIYQDQEIPAAIHQYSN
ncbi:MAG: YajG family lipoprotein [[Pasteurella] aerogenes]|nr:YajG family lipoprotein [[Pasteurella] aerogenes]